MQAWSLRGAPWIFPLHDAAVYLDALCAEEGESWIYTNGLRCCQKEIGVPFSVLLQELMQCLQVLEKEPVVSKQRLDQVLAAAMLQRIPASLTLCGCLLLHLRKGSCMERRLFPFCCGRLPFKGESPLDPDRRAHLHLQPFLTQLRKRAVSVMLRAAHWFAGFSMHTAPAM